MCYQLTHLPHLSLACTQSVWPRAARRKHAHRATGAHTLGTRARTVAPTARSPRYTVHCEHTEPLGHPAVSRRAGRAGRHEPSSKQEAFCTLVAGMVLLRWRTKDGLNVHHCGPRRLVLGIEDRRGETTADTQPARARGRLGPSVYTLLGLAADELGREIRAMQQHVCACKGGWGQQADGRKSSGARRVGCAQRGAPSIVVAELARRRACRQA